MTTKPQPSSQEQVVDDGGRQTVIFAAFLASILSELTTINATLTAMQATLDDHETRITALEP